MPLCSLLPQPAPIRLAGDVYTGRELRLCDLASLERLVGVARFGVSDPIEASLDGADPLIDRSAYREALRRAYGAFEHGVPRWGDEAVNHWVFGTLDGRSSMLGRVLRGKRRPDGDTLELLAASLKEEEWIAVDRIAFGSDPRAELVRRIDVEAGVDLDVFDMHDAAPVTWEEALVEIIAATGYTPRQVGRLTLTQARLIRSGGKVEEPGSAIPQWMPVEETVKRVSEPRQRFWAEGTVNGN